MKILHVSFSDREGGAAIAAQRLVAAQRSIGLDSRMIVARKQTSDPEIQAPLGPTGQMRIRAARFVAKRIALIGAGETRHIMRTMGLISSGIGEEIRRVKADLVHLHWIGGEMMSLKEIAAIPHPVVWTTHDMWAFCGAEHITSERRFADGYQYRGFPDIDRSVFRRKLRSWARWRPSLICPSSWMAKEVAASALMRNAYCVVIPNTLDTTIFRRTDREEARFRLGLPQFTKLILYGANKGRADPLKGFDLLERALGHLPAPAGDIELVTFGSERVATTRIAGRQAYELGEIHDWHRLALLYSAADVVVVPSRLESLSNILIEAQSCGLPGVAFDVGGIPDVIAEPLHGGLAPPFDVHALAMRIAEVLDRNGAETAEAIRISAVTRFGPERIAKEHLQLYQALLTGYPGRGPKNVIGGRQNDVAPRLEAR